MTDNVKVAIRCRPLSEKEISDGHQSIVEFGGDNRVVVEGINDQPGSKTGDRRSFLREYQFDQVFDWNSTQEEVYDKSCRPIVDSVLQGYNGTIFAYGQTGTGKTYTMEGVNSQRSASISSSSASSASGVANQRRQSNAKLQQAVMQAENLDAQAASTMGVIPRAFKHIFKHIADHSEIQFLVRVSYLEIYQENIHDLLRKDQSIKLELHERPDIGVYVKDLTTFFCKSVTEIERVMRVGNQNRRVAATDMNEHSSRSHAIFMITIEQQLKTTQNANDKSPKSCIKVGRLNLIDLAGSESQKKTNSFGERQKESVKINLSLSALGNVINSLMKANSVKPSQQAQAIHTPYRDSKLTRLLQDSLGGNAKTLMIANIGPASYNYDETINTLNYASRAKLIRNKPRLNEDPKDALLRELQKEIDDLRQKLAEIDASQPNANGKTQSNDRRNSLRIASKATNTQTKQEIVEEDATSIERELVSLKAKLVSLESKLLNNSSSDQANPIGSILGQEDTASNSQKASSLLEDYMRRQEEELRAKQVELASQTDRESAIRDEIERKQEVELMTKESFSSAQNELEAKKRLIRQILIKVKQMRDSIDAIESTFRLELDELEQLQYELSKELKLKCLIMDNFIPNHHVNQLLARISFNEQTNDCVVEPINLPIDRCLTGGAGRDSVISYDEFWEKILRMGGQKKDDKKTANKPPPFRPQTEFERLEETLFPGNIRFKCDRFVEPGARPAFQTIFERDHELPLLADELERPENEGRASKQKQAKSSIESRLQDLLNESLDAQEADIVI